MKIAVLNHKGGSGKTTSIVLLAYVLGHAGKSVGVLDYDPQRSATEWLETAPGENVEIHQPGRDYDVILIDTSPYHADPGTPRAIAEADRVILPAEANLMEMRGVRSAADIVQRLRPKLRPAILFTRFERHTEFAKNRDQFARALGLRALKNPIARRVCYKRAQTRGLAAIPPAERAALAALAIEILTLKP